MLLLGMFQNALCAEHVAVLHAIKLYLLGRMRLAELDLAFCHLTATEGWVSRRSHRQTGQHLVVHRQVVRANLMRGLIVRALDHAVLGELAHAFRAERVAAGQRRGLLIVVIVRLETDAALKDRFTHFVVVGVDESFISILL